MRQRHLIGRAGLLLLGALLCNPAWAGAPDYTKASGAYKAILKQASAQSSNDRHKAGALRDQAIEQAALIYGTQEGWLHRWHALEHKVEAQSHRLSTVFDFQALYMRHGKLQPPVLDAGSDISQINGEGTLYKLVDRVYRVIVPARFTEAPLSWRDFLLPDDLSGVSGLRTDLLPHSKAEKRLWKQGIKQGWAKGVRQADSEFHQRVVALSNAYQGMILYNILEMKGMIQPPQVVDTSTPTSTDRNGTRLIINARERIIHHPSYFVAEPDRWKPVTENSQFPAALDKGH